MSRAFVKEDVDPPERRGRPRSASGLPPGAANYITAHGVRRLQDRLEERRRDPAASDVDLKELQELIASLTVVDSLPDEPNTIAFGALVTVRDADGEVRTYRIVGVDEIEFYSNAVSWVSPPGKALLAAEVGDRVVLDGERVEIVSVEYPSE